MDWTDDDMWNGSAGDGYVSSKSEDDEGTDCENETVTLIGKGS